MSVALGTAHGGCGEVHSRPVAQGAPARVWALDCPPCEDHLRSDPLWSATVSKIPETYDEQLTREDFDKRGVLDERALMAMALAKLTGLELPETLRARVLGAGPGDVAGMLECPEGHAVLPGAKFCAECGAPMREAPAAVGCPAGHENALTAKFCAECGLTMSAPALPAAGEAEDLGALNANDLRQLAKARGIDATGTKAEVLARLKAA